MIIECHNWAPNLVLLSIHNSIFKDFCRNKKGIFYYRVYTSKIWALHYSTLQDSFQWLIIETGQRWLTTTTSVDHFRITSLKAPVTHRIWRHKLAGVDVAVETGREGIIMLSNQRHIRKKSQLYKYMLY